MSRSTLHRVGVLSIAMALVCPMAASAQIFAWRDAAGNLVLSDRKKNASAETYSVAPSATIRTTRPLSARAARYQEFIEEHAELHSISADLVRAVIQAESAFNPRAVSPKGAMGLMQLMPATAAELGVTDPFDPAENIRGGVAYLRQLLDRYGGNVELALAAYNAGPAAVTRHGGKVPPYRETRAYVAKISEDLATAGPPPPSTRVYKSVEIVNGRAVVRYTGRPRDGSELVRAAERR